MSRLIKNCTNVFLGLMFFLPVAGLLCVLVCSTKGDKVRMADDYDGTGGMLLKSNTEAPGEEVVRTCF